MKRFLAKYFSKLILLNYDRLTASEWVHYASFSVVKLSLVGLFLKFVGLWFEDNAIFLSFMILALMLNALAGVIRHLFFTKTFKWIKFFKKTGIMLMVILCVYPVLEMVAVLGGNNVVTDVFRITIQVCTFLYPGSKILKNGYIMSGKRMPPPWMMERLYDFEKTGDINKIFKYEKDDNSGINNGNVSGL